MFRREFVIVSLFLMLLGNSVLFASDLPPAVAFSRVASVVWSGTVQFSVLAADDVALLRVEVFLNNLKIAEFTRPPFDVSLDTTRYPDGHYVVTALAYDTTGRVSSASMGIYFRNKGAAVSPAQPKLLWTYEAVIERVRYYFTNVPAVGTDGTLYLAAFDNIRYNNFLFAVSSNGSLRWRYEVGTAFAGPTVGPDGTVYINTGKLIAVGPNGYRRWEVALSKDSIPGSDNYQYTPTIDSRGNIYAATRELLFAVSPSGSIMWSVQVRASTRPVVDREGVVYVTQDKLLLAFGADGRERWRVDTGGTVGWLCLGDGVILAHQTSPRSRIVAVSKRGEVVGRADVPPLLTASSIGFVIGKDGTVYGITDEEKLVALTPDGTRRWSFDIPGKLSLAGDYIIIFPANERVPLVGESGIVYVGARDALFGVSNGREVFRIPLSNPANRPLVMTDDGVLYAVSYSGMVMAIQTNDRPARSPWPMAGGNPRNTNGE